MARIEAFHKTSRGYLIFGVIELALAYLFISWAIDSGSLLDWFLTIILLAGFVQNLVRLVRKLAQGKHPG
jgi:hypothetical protein